MRAQRGLSLALPAALFALICLGGCGGSSSDGTQAATSAPASTTAVSAQAEQGEGKAKPKAEVAPADPPRQKSPEGAPLPGAKAVAPGVPTTKGGDNSIQAFGAEGQEGERAQAYAELRSYLDALGSGEYAKACGLASSQLRDELAKLIERAKAPQGQEKPQGCAGTLRALLGGASDKALEEVAQLGELLSFRVRPDGYAYLIFKGAQGKAMFIAMADNEGKWKVNVAKPEAFQSTSQGQAGAQ